MVEPVYGICGANPCYGMCPLNDPFHGDQRAENDDYEANSRNDYIREMMAGMDVEDPYDPFYYDPDMGFGIISDVREIAPVAATFVWNDDDDFPF